MRALILAFLASTGSANIIFNHVPLTCEPGTLAPVDGKTGCLRGQACIGNGTCVPEREAVEIPVLFRRYLDAHQDPTLGKQKQRRKVIYSTDGRCGPKHNNKICDPNSKVYKGTCCSEHGWCGESQAHCEAGCVSGCSKVSSSSKRQVPTSAPRSDGRCGKDFDGATCDANGPYGGCCSAYGYCGSSPAHCLSSNGRQNGCQDPASSTQTDQVSKTPAPSHVKIPTSTKRITTTVRTGALSTRKCTHSSLLSTSRAMTSSRSTVSLKVPSSSESSATSSRSSNLPTSTMASMSGFSSRTTSTSKESFSSSRQSSASLKESTSTSVPVASSSKENTSVQSRSSSSTSSRANYSSSVANEDIKTQTPTQEPALGKPTTTQKASGGGTTTDGTCGAANGNTVCGDWPQGGCCSMYGYCGNTTAHCGEGCQSGPCKGPAVQPAPGPAAAPAASVPGTLDVVGKSGVPAMHAGLMPNGKVIFLDKIENYTQLKLGNGQYAYSSEYDPATNQVKGLGYKTNAFCSGGAFLPDGRWLSLGGNGPLDFIDPTVGDGFTAIRYLSRSSSDSSLDGQDWSEPGNKLSSARWYASAQTLADGSVFVASGSLNGLDPTKPENNNPTWELLNNQGVSNGQAIPMDILAKNQPYYMYPFLHLMRDGNLFVFVSKSSESFNVATNQTNKFYPDLAGDYRTYPNTGGSVLLPLSSKTNWDPDVLICGGGAYQDITSPTDASCGRIQPLSTNPKWEMDSMPQGRGMVEGTLLPDGTVIWVNGCGTGAQGFGLAKDPTEQVLIYDPNKSLGQRWSTGPTSSIARLYHSVALLLLDGTLLITGSNPVEMPLLTPVPGQTPSEDYVTEFRVEIYTPPYLAGDNAKRRPGNIQLSSKSLQVGQGKGFTVKFDAPQGAKAASVVLYHGGFVTHSVHMNHRMAVLDTDGWKAGSTAQELSVQMPPDGNVAPPGPYVVYVMVDGVPGMGQFVSVS